MRAVARVVRVSLVAGPLFVGACLSGPGGKLERPVAHFPSKDDLQIIVARPPAMPLARPPAVPADRWQIGTAIPAAGAAYPGDTVWDRRILEANGKRPQPVRLAPELRCAGTETARFFVERGGYPEDALRDYLLERCGSTLTSMRTGTLSGSVSDDAPDSTIEESFSASLGRFVDEELSKGTEAGMGFARGKGRAVVVVYSGTPRGHIREVPGGAEAGRILLEGDVGADAAMILGLANQRDLGVALCEVDPGLPLPAFRLSCPAADEDAQTLVEVVTRKPNEVLLRRRTRLLVQRKPDAGLLFEPRGYGAAAPSSDAASFRGALVDGLNEARSEAGRRPVALEVNESKDSDQLVGPFFESGFAGKEEDSDVVALGLMAGWDVGGTIKGGAFFAELTLGSRSAGRWLTQALGTPTGRWTLLDANMSRIAVGARPLEPSGMGALVTTYSLFESSDHRADEDAVFEYLGNARAARSLAAPQRVPRGAALGVALAKISANALSSLSALGEALDRIASEERRAVSGWVVETSDLKEVPFDRSLLAPGSLDVEIGVAHHKAAGGAWGQYAVLFVLRGSGVQTTTAGRGTLRGLTADGRPM